MHDCLPCDAEAVGVLFGFLVSPYDTNRPVPFRSLRDLQNWAGLKSDRPLHEAKKSGRITRVLRDAIETAINNKYKTSSVQRDAYLAETRRILSSAPKSLSNAMDEMSLQALVRQGISREDVLVIGASPEKKAALSALFEAAASCTEAQLPPSVTSAMSDPKKAAVVQAELLRLIR
jgi:hypothetical protein